MFIVALLAEVWGLLALWTAANFNPLFVVFLFVVDLGAALMAHASSRGRCIQRNLTLLHGPVQPGTKIDLIIKGQVSTAAWVVTWLGRFMIIGLAVGKAFAIQSFKENLDESIAEPLFLTIIVAYIVAALIHLFFTGDAIFELIRGFLWSWERGGYVKGLQRGDNQVDGWPRENRWNLTSAVPLIPDSSKSREVVFGRWGKHILREVDAGKGQYELITKSTLQDEDVIDLCNRMGVLKANTARLAMSELRRECIQMQYTIFMGLVDPVDAADGQH
jgi:hypothetical protein